MEEAFYIIQTREDWYRLHFSETHYVLGCGSDVKKLLETLRRLIKRCKNIKNVRKLIESFEDRGVVNENTRSVYEEELKDSNHCCDVIVAQTIRDALEEVKFDTPFHRNRKKHKLIGSNHCSDVIEEKTEEEIRPVSLKVGKKFKRNR